MISQLVSNIDRAWRGESLEKEAISSLELAYNCLEEAIKSATEKKEHNLGELVWKASSELEYSLFLLSMKIGEENLPKINPSSRFDPKFKGEIGPFLVSIQDLTAEAIKLLKKKLYSEAYEAARAARNGLLRLHTMLERQRKEKKKKR